MSAKEKLVLIQKHIDKRFQDLERRLKLDKRVIARFPGSNGKHSLGVGIAKQTWESLDSKMGDSIPKYIEKKITDLSKTYKGRIEFGNIGNKATDSRPGLSSDKKKFNIHVFGANENNWNRNIGEDIIGAGQAGDMGKQRVGIFGISTMPPKELNSKLESSLLNQDSTKEKFYNDEISKLDGKPEPPIPELKPIETKPSETKPVESKPIESKPNEPKPIESKPIESKPSEPKPSEPKTGENKLKSLPILDLKKSYKEYKLENDDLDGIFVFMYGNTNMEVLNSNIKDKNMYYLRNNSRYARISNWMRYFSGSSKLHKGSTASLIEIAPENEKFTYGYIVKLEPNDLNKLKNQQGYNNENYILHKLPISKMSVYSGKNWVKPEVGLRIFTYLKKNLKEKYEGINPVYLLDTCKTLVGLNLKGEKPEEYKNMKNSLDVYYINNNKLEGENKSCIPEDDPIRIIKAKPEEKTDIEVETYAAGTITREEMQLYNDTVGETHSFDKFRDTYCTIAKIMTSVLYNMVESVKKPINFFSFNAKKGVTEVIVLNRLIRQGLLINKVIMTNDDYSDKELVQTITDEIYKLTGISKSNILLSPIDKLKEGDIPDEDVYVMFDNCNPKNKPWKEGDKFNMGAFVINDLKEKAKITEVKLKKSIKYILAFENHSWLFQEGKGSEKPFDYPVFTIYRSKGKKISAKAKEIETTQSSLYSNAYKTILLNAFKTKTKTEEIEYNKKVRILIRIASLNSEIKNADINFLKSIYKSLYEQLVTVCQNVMIIKIDGENKRKYNDICIDVNDHSGIKLIVNYSSDKNDSNKKATDFVYNELFTSFNKKIKDNKDVDNVFITKSERCNISRNTYYVDYRKYLPVIDGEISYDIENNKEDIRERINNDVMFITHDMRSQALIIRDIEENLKLESQLEITIKIPEMRLIFLLISHDLCLLFFKLLEYELDYLIGNMNYRVNIINKQLLKHILLKSGKYNKKELNEKFKNIYNFYKKNLHSYFRILLDQSIYSSKDLKNYDGLYTDKEMADIFRNMDIKKIEIDEQFRTNVKKMKNMYHPNLGQRFLSKLFYTTRNIGVSDKDIYLLKQELTDLYKDLTFSKEVLSKETINNFSKVLNNIASQISTSMGVFDGKYNASIKIMIVNRQDELDLWKGTLHTNKFYKLEKAGDSNKFMKETLIGYEIDGKEVKSISGTLHKISNILGDRNPDYNKKRQEIKEQREKEQEILGKSKSDMFDLDYGTTFNKMSSKFKIVK